jgi:hypothetical protein
MKVNHPSPPRNNRSGADHNHIMKTAAQANGRLDELQQQMSQGTPRSQSQTQHGTNVPHKKQADAGLD